MADLLGIDDLELALPDLWMDHQVVLAQRASEDPEWDRRLKRALETTQQAGMRFPRLWEDPVTLAAQGAFDLIQRQNPADLGHLRFLTLGTETAVDMSKSGSNYVLGALQKAGMNLPRTLSSYQVQHACAGGTLALLACAGLLQAGGRREDWGLVMTSDIARYKAPSTAEITQGAGAAAVKVSLAPRLLSLDLASTGYHSADVDDFFRPLGSTTAVVKGGFSVQCYIEALIGAYEDHCARLGVSPAQELESTDLFALHIPYAQMPLQALEKLLEKHLGLDQKAAGEFLAQRGFFASLEPTRVVGNLYTGSLYLGLAFSLKERMAVWGAQAPGKKVLLASYGSGNTMAVVSGRIQSGAAQVVQSWDLEGLLDRKTSAGFDLYRQWLETPKTPETYPGLLKVEEIPSGRFYLAGLREDGYREYAFR